MVPVEKERCLLREGASDHRATVGVFFRHKICLLYHALLTHINVRGHHVPASKGFSFRFSFPRVKKNRSDKDIRR